LPNPYFSNGYVPFGNPYFASLPPYMDPDYARPAAKKAFGYYPWDTDAFNRWLYSSFPPAVKPDGVGSGSNTPTTFPTLTELTAAAKKTSVPTCENCLFHDEAKDASVFFGHRHGDPRPAAAAAKPSRKKSLAAPAPSLLELNAEVRWDRHEPDCQGCDYAPVAKKAAPAPPAAAAPPPLPRKSLLEAGSKSKSKSDHEPSCQGCEYAPARDE